MVINSLYSLLLQITLDKSYHRLLIVTKRILKGVAGMSESKYYCPVEVTVDVIGGKWKCVILWWLRQDAKRFSELKQLIPGISQKVLTQQLRELEANGLIRREVYREKPPRVEYLLTPYGETVRPITELMCNWGKAHMPGYEFGYRQHSDA
jgi:DNA-binding HxlR family transcriptional regulator